MLEHLQAGDDIETAGAFGGQLFDCHMAVVHLAPRFEQVQASDSERFLGQVDAGDPGALSRHALSQQTAAAADVENLLAG